MHVSIRNLAKSFGRVAALREASFDVAPGEIVALVGANGAGKTTLLRALAGIVAPDGGEIRYDGELFRRDRLDLRRRLFLLADLPPVIPGMTVLRHIGMVVGLYEAERPGLEEEICTLLQEFDILPLVESRFSTLSRGQTYKACLAALLLAGADLWLFDEPFGAGLDPQGLAVLRRHVRAAARGATVIYSTQLLQLAAGFSDRLCVLGDGRVLGIDSLEGLEQAAGAEGELRRMLDALDEETA